MSRLNEFMPTITRVANKITKEHREVEYDDVKQELILFVLQRGDTFPTPAEAKAKGWSMSSLLFRQGKMYAFTQKQEHYMIDPQQSYKVSDVKEILSTFFYDHHWDIVQDNDKVEELLAHYSDVGWALDRLVPAKKQFVANCYKAERLPLSGTKEYRKLRDIIIEIANMLNHFSRADENDGPGRRKALSNAASQAMIDAGTNGADGNV